MCLHAQWGMVGGWGGDQPCVPSTDFHLALPNDEVNGSLYAPSVEWALQLTMKTHVTCDNTGDGKGDV